METCPHPECRHPIDDDVVTEVIKKNFDIDISHMCFYRGVCNHKHVLWSSKNKAELGAEGLPDSYMPGYCKIKSETPKQIPTAEDSQSQSKIRGRTREAARG